MKDNTIRFSILLFLYYCRYCILYSFASVFFEEQGFSAVQIGQLAAISGFVVIFAGPLMGMLADRAGGEKKVVLTCLIMTLFLTAGVYAARKVFWPLLLLYGTVAFFDKAVSPLMDSWIVRSKRGKEALPYGKIRAVGSLGGALCAVGTGALIDAAGFGAVFLLHMGMTALLILGTVRVRDGIKEREKKKTDEAISAGDGADMAQNGGGTLPVFYGILLTVTILLFTGVTAEVTYYPILFQECGGRKAWLGTICFLGRLHRKAAAGVFRRGDFFDPFPDAAAAAAGRGLWNLAAGGDGNGPFPGGKTADRHGAERMLCGDAGCGGGAWQLDRGGNL